MKGAVFIALNEMVESEHGLDAWETLLAEVNPSSEGIYTSTEDYPDSEIVDFVLAASKLLGVESTDLTRHFGHFLFKELNGKFPIFSQLTPDFFQFLNSIESVIHQEVKKLFDNPSLPEIECFEESGSLNMFYSSPRKLCFLAEGLIFGAAEHYKKKISIDHIKCMHKDDSRCHFKIKILNQ